MKRKNEKDWLEDSWEEGTGSKDNGNQIYEEHTVRTKQNRKLILMKSMKDIKRLWRRLWCKLSNVVTNGNEVKCGGNVCNWNSLGKSEEEGGKQHLCSFSIN